MLSYIAVFVFGVVMGWLTALLYWRFLDRSLVEAKQLFGEQPEPIDPHPYDQDNRC